MTNIASLLLLLCPFILCATPTPSIVEVSSHASQGGPAVDTTLGFIVEVDGFLLTTYQQLINERGNLRPFFSVQVPQKKKSYPAKIIGVEPTLNFAVLQIQAPTESFEPSIVSRDRSIVPGQALYATTQATLPAANLATGRLLKLNNLECYQQSLTGTMFTADFQIDQRSVGSPVFDDTGKVIAFYTGYKPSHAPDDNSHVDDESITHLLPIFLAFNIYESIKQRQSLASPWTGFSIRPLTALELQQFPVAKGRYTGGVALEYIWQNSSAAKMGLQVDDILVRFAYNPTPSPAEFQKWLYMYGVGRKIELWFLRDGELFKHDYVVEERPEWANPK